MTKRLKINILYIILLIILIYSLYISIGIKPYYKSILGDIGGNLFFIPFVYIIFFLFEKVPIKSFFFDNSFFLIILILVEIFQHFTPLGVFDYLDIIGLFIGYIISLIIFSFYKEYDKK